MNLLRLRKLLIVVLMSLVACATQREKSENPATLVWPSPPAEPRVVFIRSVSTPADFGISKGVLQRLSDFIFGETDARLIRPMAVAEVNGVVFVADPGAKGVHRFDTRAGRHDMVRTPDGISFISPVGLAVGADQSVFVADSALGRIFLIPHGARSALHLALSDPLRQPTGVAFDGRTRRLYVSDTAAHCIKVFSNEGKLLSTIGRRGFEDGEFNFPTMLWLGRAGKLLVTDSLNFRTQSFDSDGRFLSKFGRVGDGSGDTPRQKGIATDRGDHVYVVDSLLHAVQVFDSSGAFLLSIGGLGAAPGEFRLPAGIYINQENMIYIADAYNQRIQIFKYVGDSE